MLSLAHFLIVAAALFSIGLAVMITKRNAIGVLIGLELVLNAVNINLVAFSQYDARLSGQMFALFVLVVAAAESAVALAIILKVYRHFQTVDLDKINLMKK